MNLETEIMKLQYEIEQLFLKHHIYEPELNNAFLKFKKAIEVKE